MQFFATLGSFTVAALVAPATSQILPASVQLGSKPLTESSSAFDKTTVVKSVSSLDFIRPESGLRVSGRRTTATSCFPQANKIKLQSSTGKPIRVFEVQVLASGTNIAEGKTAIQGSTFKDKEGVFGASMAVDGDNTTFSHTKRNDCSWIEVDFGGTFGVESFTILNRYCGNDTSDPKDCLCKLSHATVSLLGDDGEWVDGVWLGDTCSELTVEKAFAAVCPAPPTISPVSTPDSTPVPTLDPTPDPTSDPTPAPTPGPTPEPTPSPITPLPLFEYFGLGYCTSSALDYYSYIFSWDESVKASDTSCIDWCSQNLHPDLVGVGRHPFYCYCYFSGAIPGDVSTTDYSPAAQSSVTSSGHGPVSNLGSGLGSSETSCYRNTLYGV